MTSDKPAKSGRKIEREMTKDQVGVIYRWAIETLGINNTDLAQAMKVSPETISRWLRGNTMPYPKNIQKINTLGDFQYICGKVFVTPEDTERWMRERVPALNGQTPMFYFLYGDLEGLISVLATIESGAFV